MIPQRELHKLLHYHPGTGVFTWRIQSSPRAKAGTVAGTSEKRGHRKIRVQGVTYKSHRLAFIYMVGWVPPQVDHINRDPSDNRWCNLRAATVSQNAANAKHRVNNTSGYRGVTWDKSRSKWKASICVQGKQKHIGNFDCKHHAFCEYVLAARKYFGKYASV